MIPSQQGKQQFPILLLLLSLTIGTHYAFAQSTDGGENALGYEIEPEQSSTTLLNVPKQYLDGLVERKLDLEERNVSLHFVTNEEQPPNASHVLVFVHGFPQFWYVWRHQLQHFKSEQIVYAFDLRGYGLSSRPVDTLTYTIASQVDDLIAAVEAVKAAHPGIPVTLVTHDIGAAIGATLQYKSPVLVKRFVQINGPNPNTLNAAFFAKNPKLLAKALFATPYFRKILQWQFPDTEHTLSDNDYAFVRNLFLNMTDGGVQHQGPNTLNATDVQVYVNSLAQAAKPDELNAVTSALNFYRAPLKDFAHKTVITAKDLISKLKAIFTYSGKNEAQKGATEKGATEKAPTAAPVTKIQAKCLVIWGAKDAAFGDKSYADAAEGACKQGRLVYMTGIGHWVPEDTPADVIEQIQTLLDN